MAFTVTLTEAEDAEAQKAVIAGLQAFNAPFAGPYNDHRPLNLVVRRAGEAAVAGGLIGTTGFGWLFTRLLWLPEDLRRTGLGSALLRQAEEVARGRGCVGAWVDTFSFQARPFYERMGYTVFGTLPGQPPGHERYFLMKRLAP